MENILKKTDPNQKLIKGLILLQVKKHLGDISDDEYDQAIMDLNNELTITDYVEKISSVGFNEIINRIDEFESEARVELLLNEEVQVYLDELIIPVNCDVIIFGRKTIEIINILPTEGNRVNILDDLETKLVALAVINKFLTSICCDLIRITIIQPNLAVTSIYETDISSLLHQCEYSITNMCIRR